MKRKRLAQQVACVSKRVKLAEDSPIHPGTPLLRQYYPHVTSLRHYLVSRLARGSKRRRQKLQQYGLDDAANADSSRTALVALLDCTVVGTFSLVNNLDAKVIENDLSVFTQQLSAQSPSQILTQGALNQKEIIDFVVWLLFRRQVGNYRPNHMLCLGYQRYAYATNGAELETVPGVPGLMCNTANVHVLALKESPWTALPSLLGSNAERIIAELLVECGVFVPVADSSNLKQLSGVPLSEQKPWQNTVDEVPKVNCKNPALTRAQVTTSQTQVKQRGLSDVRLVRHRMLYARYSVNARNRVQIGLGQTHVLNRLHGVVNRDKGIHLLKYVFPRQFKLHNVFTSDVNHRETAQPFKDYASREKDIARAALESKRKHTGKAASYVEALPKRLRSDTLQLMQRLLKRHTNTSYHTLLDHYCPLSSTNESASQGSVNHATSAARVSAYCKAAVNRVFPTDTWGTGESGVHNRKVMMRAVDTFVRLRRYETLSMHDIMAGIKITGIPWLCSRATDQTTKLSATDFAKRKELFAELLYYVFDSFLISLIRGTFHATESNAHRNQLFYFRHDVWRAISEPALDTMKTNMLEECSGAAVKKMLAQRALGVSQVRLLPKEQGMRPIINLRRRVQKLQHGELVLGRSINSILTPAFSVLNYEKSARPEMLGSALFSVDDLFPRLQSFRESLRMQGRESAKLYFAKVDVQACFDTIPQKQLMSLARTILQSDTYQIARYARAKLVGGHNKEFPGFGAKPSWKFLTKATSEDQPFAFDEEIGTDTADGRTRAIYVDGVQQRTEKRGAILDLLTEHVESNLIQIGKRYYRQKKGIPQGSIVSSLLCSYLYAELERTALGFLNDKQTLLLRLIDDILVISTVRGVAERFMHTMHAGIPQFGVQVKLEKSRANFDVSIDGKAIARLPDAVDFPYCGNAINTVTLDLSKDQERLNKHNAAAAITVEFSKLPGQSFYRKTLNALKLQMRAMLLSTSYNSLETVLSNLHHCFTQVALKSFHYIRSMSGSSKQPGDRLVIKTIDDLISLASVLMKRRKRSSKDIVPYSCAVTPAQAKWVACTAFAAVFQRRQTRHTGLLAWLGVQLAMPALRSQAGQLDRVARGKRSACDTAADGGGGAGSG